MKIALSQINPTVGDFAGNIRLILEFRDRAADKGADLAVFPELCICGYPPADLLEKRSFLARAGEALEQIAAQTASGPAIICGTALPTGAVDGQLSEGKRACNVAALLSGGRISFLQQKMLLPFYDVFDEQRYFEPAVRQSLTTLNGEPLALTICEDAWNDKGFWPLRFYAVDPVNDLMLQWATLPDPLAVHPRLILNISASPFWCGKQQLRRDMLSAIARRHSAVVVMVNQVGGNDSLIFDGSSMALAPDGEVVAQAASFREDLIVFDTVDFESGRNPSAPPSRQAADTPQAMSVDPRLSEPLPITKTMTVTEGISAKDLAEKLDVRGKDVIATLLMKGVFVTVNQPLDGELVKDVARQFGANAQVISVEEQLENKAICPVYPCGFGETAAIWDALVLGTRDYVRKCGFSQALIALSGGIDSALVAAIAVEALGAENVLGVGMPSEFSSTGSIDDARALAANLGIRFELLAIHHIVAQYQLTLEPLFAGTPFGLAEENLQSRIRGVLLMAISNKFGALVLTTGNKSEMSTGYCTLYGDMVGALAVIGDVFKTRVYALSRYANREGEVIPRNTLEKPPSAELRPDQRDTDSLPPYEILDPILEAYVERYCSAEQILAERTAAGDSVDLALIRRVLSLVERSEYKRQQAAPVLKVTQKSFGNGRRFPIAVKVEM